jgi:hypothetical protein
MPNHIVSLSGPSKTGKTVLCRRILGDREYIWIDGGQINSVDDFWDRARAELTLANSETTSDGVETGVDGGISLPVLTAKGSRLYRRSKERHFAFNNIMQVVDALLANGIILVIDDFHYLKPDDRSVLMRNVKGAVFNGLKVILVSVTHRAFDVVKAEPELTGRFSTVTVPTWAYGDLEQIATLGFNELNVNVDKAIIHQFTREAQESPFLMQRFCWELCFDNGIEKKGLFAKNIALFESKKMFISIAKDAGLPTYQKLAAGPQSRKVRNKRPLASGNNADIYEVVLLALAQTGPKLKVSYEELRETMNRLLVSMMPQKHEITAAVKHLAAISRGAGTQDAIDWDEGNREITVADPYLRFYLRWQVRSHDDDGSPRLL